MRYGPEFLILMLLGGLSGCGNNEPETGDPPVPVARTNGAQSDSTDVAAASATGPVVKEYHGLRFDIPAGWREQELSGMRKSILDAAYIVNVDGEKVEVTLSSSGGGIDANLNRWRGQIDSGPGDDEKLETLRTAGTDATWIDLRGTYTKGFGANVQQFPDWRLLGVAIPLGEQDYYLKLTGPRQAVLEVHDAFRRFAKSARSSH